MNKTTLSWVGLLAAMAPLAVAAQGVEPEKRNVDGIMDNSFLVEEAYNQGPGVVQHIFTAWYAVDRAGGSDSHAWLFSFTQEWPVFSQRHQFSYTVPWSAIDAGVGHRTEINDTLLNYRYQAYFDEQSLTAFAPRLTLVLPAGNPARGAGDDTVGFSTALGDSWFVHANAGLTCLPDASSVGGRDALHYNFGASAIYALTEDVHLMLECVGVWTEQPSGGGTTHEFTALLSPGVRKAFNFVRGQQLVVGVAAPIGLNRQSPDWGVFAYVSFEHFFSRPANGKP
jgi:hypothetical protein